MSDLNSAYNGEGEDDFFSYIKDTCKTIFDVGCFAGTYENGDRAVNVFTHLEDVDVQMYDAYKASTLPEEPDSVINEERKKLLKNKQNPTP